MSVGKRFMDKVSIEPNSGCWLWTGAVLKDGYGVLRVDRRSVTATHVSLNLDGRSRPSKGHYALHSCDNPYCVNPEHLRWGTPAENSADMMVRTITPLTKRTHCKRGHSVEDNIYNGPAGRTECRTCKSEASARSYHKKRSEHLAQDSAPPAFSAVTTE